LNFVLGRRWPRSQVYGCSNSAWDKI